MGSLYERLGGSKAVDAVVESFYLKVLADKRINGYFEGVDMKRQIHKQKAFLTMVFGGPNTYTGQDMRRGHKHLVRRGLNDSHVDAVIELLEAALLEHQVSTSDIDEVKNIANSVRDEVLNRSVV